MQSKAVTGRAYARAGLLGNPSDVYEGKAIALSVCNFDAVVRLEPADGFRIVPGPAEELRFASLREASEALRLRGCDDATRLLRAAIKRFLEHWGGLENLSPADPRLRFELSYVTEIPRQVGLAGSSAIIIAAIRALMAWFGVEIHPAELAELALAAELEDLGITAGPMDRVIQAYGGLMHMDFKPPRTPASYTRLDPSLLPPLFIAWDPHGGQPSARVHDGVRLRWLRGDRAVHRAMGIFPRLVDEGMGCLERRDFSGLRKLVDANYDARASIWSLGERDRAMIRIGRAEGVSLKLCGSGGAVIGIMRDEGELPRLEAAYADAGFRVLCPQILPRASDQERT